MAKKKKKPCDRIPIGLSCDFARNEQGILSISSHQATGYSSLVTYYKTEIELDYKVFEKNPFTMWELMKELKKVYGDSTKFILI